MAVLNDLTMQQILARIMGCLIFCALHGGLLAGISALFGNRQPLWDGRLSLNPFQHLPLPALFMSILFHSAWIRPMRIDPAATKGGRLALPLIALLALGLTLLAIPLFDLLRSLAVDHLPPAGGFAAIECLTEAQRIILASVLLNLLPLPVLTGRLFLIALAPQLQKRLTRLEGPATALIVIALIAGWWPDFGWLLRYVSRLG